MRKDPTSPVTFVPHVVPSITGVQTLDCGIFKSVLCCQLQNSRTQALHETLYIAQCTVFTQTDGVEWMNRGRLTRGLAQLLQLLEELV